jgi:hypothetical protein
MRIGRTFIDTDNMSIEELTTVIKELRDIRKRKEQAHALEMRMNDLIVEAKDNGFTFIDNACGFVREVDDFTLYDERA